MGPPAIPPAPENPLRALPWVIGAHFLCAVGFSVFSLLPKYLMTFHGYDQAQVGPVAMGIPLGSALCSPLAVFFMGRISRRGLIRLGTLVFACAALSFPYAIDHGAEVALTFVAGAAAMAIFNGTSALVAELSPARATARFIGLHGAAGMLGYGLGPLIFEKTAAVWGFHAAFAIAATLNLVGSCIPLPAGAAKPSVRQGPGLPLRALTSLLAVSFLVGIMHYALWSWHQPLVLARGGTDVHPYFTGMSAGALLMRVVFGGLPDRAGVYRTALVSGVAYVLAALAMTWVTPSTLALTGFGHGVAHGVFYPSMAAYAMTKAGPDARGRVLASLYAAFSLGGSCANLAFSQVGKAYGPASVFPLAAASGCIAVFLLWQPRGTQPSIARNAARSPASASCARDPRGS